MSTPNANLGEFEILTSIGRAAELAEHYPEDRIYWLSECDALQVQLSDLTGTPLAEVRAEVEFHISLMRMVEEIDLLVDGFDG